MIRIRLGVLCVCVCVDREETRTEHAVEGLKRKVSMDHGSYMKQQCANQWTSLRVLIRGKIGICEF